MIINSYNKETALLVKSLPSIAEEDCFAMHGGTAINLFYKDLPRLSVDIDLTYIPIEDRNTSLENITSALRRIKARLTSSMISSNIELKESISKLIVSADNVSIKIEVNQTKRGILLPCPVLPICYKARSMFDSYCEIKVVDKGLLYGGKICAALDRQHPRDLFDVKLLLEEDGITQGIKEGFLLCLLSSNRPTHEILFPTLQDQRKTLEEKFLGMTDETFTYKEFEEIRIKLIKDLHRKLTERDKSFLLDFESGLPDWKVYDFSKFPGIRWKQMHIKKLKDSNLRKFDKLVKELSVKLDSL